ncbi:MAG: CCA tRNA nucleotidyltransferase [Candidatus Nanohaloarchaea archaeon]
MEWERVREKVLEEVYPSEEELKETKKMYRKLSEYINKEHGLDTHFAGSVSRETCMAGDKDIDLFVLFPEDTERQELERKGLEIGKSVFKRFDGEFEIDYAEHPYTKGVIESHEVEIVPCFDTDPEDIKSSVDRTPHHSRWVDENLDRQQRKDVVLLKKFLSVHGIYGSSLKIEGFSGYLCEILIEEYGSFKNLLEAADEWKENELIDPEEHHEELPTELKKKFRDEPLVVIDPVDQERNVASVLSKENLAKFIYYSWEFLEKPGVDSFREEEIDYTEFEVEQEIDSRADFLVLEFKNIDEVDDIVYPQMRKTLSRLESELRKRDFRIFTSGFHVGEKTRILFEMDRNLPDSTEQKGPSVFHGINHIKKFSSKYDNTFVCGDRLTAKIKREYPDAKKFLQNFLEDDLVDKGIPENVAERIEDYRFIDPVQNDENWLNYLGEKLHIETNDDKNKSS